MSESQTDTNKEELRAFEKKMHDEGAAAFADGPSPWETWDDKSDPKANNRVWEGSSKRIYPTQRPQQSLGDRVLSGLAMLSLATMVVGIAGVYFSDPQPRQIAATGTGVQPLPIDHTPPDADSLIASVEQLPPSAAGTPTAADHAAATRRDDAPPSAPATRPAPEPEITANAAPASHSIVQTPALPGVIDAADSMVDPAAQSVPAGYPPAVASGTTDPAARLETDAAPVAIAPQHVAVNDTGGTPIEPVAPPAAAPVSVTTATATNATATAEGATASALASAAGIETGTDPAPATTVPVEISASAAVATTQTGTDAADTLASLEALPASPSAAAVAPAAGIEAGIDPAPATTVPVEISASAAVATTQTGTDAADTLASLEALPVPMAGPAVTVEDAPADNTAMPQVAATDRVVAIAGAAEQNSEGITTAPAEAAKEIIPATKTGDWVVNLASYTRESTARRMLAGFRAKGVDAELVTVTINDKPMHRVRVAGFASSRAARASITPLEQQLDLEGIWISRE